MIDMIINNTGKSIGLILLVCFVAYGVWRKSQKKRAAHAADVFKNKVLTELEGLYPIPRYLDKNLCNRFKESIPAIRSAAAEFRAFIPAKCRDPFDAALTDYCDHCAKITWESCVTFNIVPGMRKPDDIGPKEIFRQNVNALLSFAKQK